ncbi:restriction endonuclease subunit S [Candidatus Nephthysia bennettiae]|uniref:Restriction endonuclease subunit S n=1 Tax=Candidatus Nephthysia bennettiae TaxID=3127016 RepID=A0A934N2J7_9BACT|nr:restriction endonuclease subunit S [Candidatus Dormibacteraeota bacterium]MBJ7613573.1 restriction endonuclease subunit S [Candidatus Dormibacteraeota bacterium]
MNNWPTAQLGEHIKIKHGFAFQGKYFGDRGDYIVLTPGNFLESGGFKPKSGIEKFYTDTPPPEFVLRRGDLVIAMTEQAEGLLGSSAVIPTDATYLHNQRIGLVEVCSGEVHRRFLYYLFNTRAVRDQIKATATGSKVRHTAPARVEAVAVSLPPLSTQRKIAAVLSAYDNLIDNNTRRIKLLEEMAQRVYREWFVDFRYPGHESMRLVDSELGPIPESWKIVPLFDVARVTFGYPFKSALFNEVNGLPVIRIRDILNGYSSTLTTEPAPAEVLVRNGDILIGMDGDFHMACWSAGDALLNQRVTRIRPASERISRLGLFNALRQPIAEWNSAIVGTTVAHLGKSHLERMKLVIPDSATANRIRSLFDPLLEEEIVLRQITRNLHDTRDLLLPRLISGEIDVDDLDIAIEDAVA